jgi:hypothetical protein
MNEKTCRNCRHYSVSWDPSAPHSCKLYQIKSKMLPKMIIKQTTGGKDCLGFAPKKKPQDRGRDLNDPKLW